MEPSKEQFYLRRIAELEKQVAEFLAQAAKLPQQVGTLSKNSSNSSKPPSSDIVNRPAYNAGNEKLGRHALLRKSLDCSSYLCPA